MASLNGARSSPSGGGDAQRTGSDIRVPRFLTWDGERSAAGYRVVRSRPSNPGQAVAPRYARGTSKSTNLRSRAAHPHPRAFARRTCGPAPRRCGPGRARRAECRARSGDAWCGSTPACRALFRRAPRSGRGWLARLAWSPLPPMRRSPVPTHRWKRRESIVPEVSPFSHLATGDRCSSGSRRPRGGLRSHAPKYNGLPRPHGVAVSTPAFHAGSGGSIPPGGTTDCGDRLRAFVEDERPTPSREAGRSRPF